MSVTAVIAVVVFSALAIIAAVFPRRRSRPQRPQSQGKNEDLGDLNGVEVVSTNQGTTIRRNGKVVYQSDARGVNIDTRGGQTKVSDIGGRDAKRK